MKKTIAIIGLGYVGAPLAYALAPNFNVIGFDINKSRVAELVQGVDRTNELTKEELLGAPINITADTAILRTADVFIITVPTPVSDAHVPDLGFVLNASRLVGEYMKPGAIVVYESTVYPGATEDICLPVLMHTSGLSYPENFGLGYSPERINPGDKVHTLHNTVKIVSGDRPEVCAVLAKIYGSVTQIHMAPSIKVAEAAKVLENVQRDVNIALMNEVSQIFSRIGVDSHHVLQAAGTKWNFLKFEPGLVGGHCISVDPYYLSHKAACEGFQAKVILSARETNDSMPAFIVDQLIKKLAVAGLMHKGTVVTVLGATFKEDVPDIRNSKIADMCKELLKYGITAQVVDPLANPAELHHEFGIKLVSMEQAKENRADAVVFAVPHENFLAGGWELVEALAKTGGAVVMDMKAKLSLDAVPANITLWRP